MVTLNLESPFTSGENVGKLLIIPKNELIERKANAIAIDRALIISGYTLIIALIIMLVIEYLFIRTIKKIAADLNKIDPGGSEQLKCPPRHIKDEIGGLVKDINFLLNLSSEKINSERLLRQKYEKLEQRFRMLFENAGVGICLLNASCEIILVNPVFQEIMQLEDQRMSTGQNYLHALFIEGNKIDSLAHETLTTGVQNTGDFQLSGENGKNERWVHCLFSKVNIDEQSEFDGHLFTQLIIIEITERKLQERLAQFQAEHDPLTKMLNRRSIETKLVQMLAKSEIENRPVSIIMLDLDNFKPINDLYGHDAGDTVLKTVATRILSSLRSDDLAARLGGDEFLIALLCKSDSCREDITSLARKLISLITQDIEIANGLRVNIGVSIGISISVSKNKSENIENLIECADKAMYQVKKTGKNDFRIYE
ncbi:MAG: diguanylate cyclase [Gammaproteobacteria bacterium]